MGSGKYGELKIRMFDVIAQFFRFFISFGVKIDRVGLP
jgi:hypothetical protein